MPGFPKWYLEKSGEILNGIGTQTNPKIQEFIQETSDLEGLDISFLQVGYGFAPEPITPQSYIARGPYSNPDSYKEQMNASVKRGWLANGGVGKYKLTEKAVEVVERFFEFGNGLFGAINGLSHEENSRIADLLAKLVENAYEQDKPAIKPSLEIGRRLEPGPDVEPMLRIRRYLTDMAYYREDVHTASWQPYEVDGKVWETLTYIWRGEASSAAEIAEQVTEYRSYSEADYGVAIDDLVSRGWLTQDNGKYVITEDGKKVRQEAEDITDQLYAAPFEELSNEEIGELSGLMKKLSDFVKVPESEETV